LEQNKNELAEKLYTTLKANRDSVIDTARRKKGDKRKPEKK
jgi:hypothetical protein